MGRGHGAQQLAAHQGQQFLFTVRQPGKALLHELRRGDDGVVVAHLGAVQDAADLRGERRTLHERQHGNEVGHDARRRLLHVVGEKAAVRPGIGQQALFIQRLGVVKGLLGGEAEKPVGLPLQGGEVVQLGRLFGFLLPLDGSTNGLRSPAGRLDALRLGGVGEAVACRLHAAPGDMDDVIFLFLEAGDFDLPLHQHFQGGGLDAAYGQGLVVQHREKPGGVNADQPIRLGPAQRRLMQGVIVPARFQVGEALPDGAVLHAGNPQPLHGLGTARQVVDRAEDQFALPPGVAGVDNLAHFLGAKQRPQGVEPLPLVRGDGQPPALRDDGQILVAPLLETLVIQGGVRKGHQMPDAPGHDVAVALQVALLPVGRPDHGGDAPGHAGFFCNYKLHSNLLLS